MPKLYPLHIQQPIPGDARTLCGFLSLLIRFNGLQLIKHQNDVEGIENNLIMM